MLAVLLTMLAITVQWLAVIVPLRYGSGGAATAIIVMLGLVVVIPSGCGSGGATAADSVMLVLVVRSW